MKDTAKHRQALEEQRLALLETDEIARQGAETVELDQSRVGRLSRMDAMQNQAMNQESQRRRLQQLRSIDSAILRIENNDYGFCDECGEDIDPRRLKLHPAASLCIQCAQKQEDADLK